MRSSLKKYQPKPEEFAPLEKVLGGKMTVINQYPKFLYTFKFNQITKESIPKTALDGFDAQMQQETCKSLSDLKSHMDAKIGGINAKIFLNVIEKDRVSTEFQFKDKIGRNIATVTQVFADCPNLDALKAS